MLFSQKQLKFIEKALMVAVVAMVFELCIPHYALAGELQENYASGPANFLLVSAIDENGLNNPYILPENINKEPHMVRYITATAYSSTEDQCDSSPFITANGTFVRDGIIAANFLPFGTKVKIPELFGDKVFSVEDRMNSKYYYRIDIWMLTRQEAKDFGKQYIKIEIY